MNMGGNYNKFTDIPKRVRNSIQKRIENTVGKYGFTEFRMCATKFIQDVKDEQRLQDEIAEKTQELEELKRKKNG